MGVSLDGITAGFDTLVFTCTYQLCHKNDNKTCVVGRQLAAVEDRPRRLGEKQKEMVGRQLGADEDRPRVYLSDSSCLGRVIPDVDTTRPGVMTCPGSTATAVPPAADVDSHSNLDSPPTRLPEEHQPASSGNLAGLCALVAVAVSCFHLLMLISTGLLEPWFSLHYC